MAAISVMVFHYQHFFYPEAGVPIPEEIAPTQPLFWLLKPLYDQGSLAVQLFWVISGFVFAATYVSQHTSLRDYAINRLARLYPLHLLTLCVVALLQFASWVTVGHFQIYSNNDAYHFALNLFMGQYWGFERGVSLNGPTWSISVEVVIYAAFFLSLPLLKRWPLFVSISGITLAVLLSVSDGSNRFAECAMFFYIGTASWVVVARSPIKALILGVLAIGGLAAYRLVQGPGSVSILGYGLPFGGIILIVAALDWLRPLSSSKLDWFGDATYGSYLLHVPVQIAALVVIQYLGFDQLALAAGPWLLPIYIVAVFALSVLSFRFFESPLRTLIRRFARKTHGTAQAAAP